MSDYGVNYDHDGTMTGLWFKPGTIVRDGNEYWNISLGDLRRLVDSISTSAWDESLGDEFNV